MDAQTTDWLARKAITLIVFVFSFAVHEFAHALTATLCGDDTPRKQGRVTLNPVEHLDALGFFCTMVFGFGWAKPVEFNPRNFRHSKTYSLLTAAAGPLSNFVLALFCFVMLNAMPSFSMPVAMHKTFVQIFQAGAAINVLLGVFNFLPIPPLDGGHLLMVIFDEKLPEVSLWMRQNHFLTMIILLMMMFLMGGAFLNAIYGSVYVFLAQLVGGIA